MKKEDTHMSKPLMKVGPNGVVLYGFQFIAANGLIVTIWAETYRDAVREMRESC